MDFETEKTEQQITSDQFQQLAKKMIELAGKETKIDGGNHDVTTKRSSM